MLTDTHCHLASRQFRGDVSAVVARARAAGVTRMVSLATDLDDASQCLEIARQHPGVYAAIGIHPTSVCEIDDGDWLGQIEAQARQPGVVAIGEIGLDYYHPPRAGFSVEDYRARQKDFLRQQLELAVRLGKNVVLHNRESWADLVEEVRPFSGKLRAVFHCFTGTREEAEEVIAQGHLVSFTGIATYPKPGNVLTSAKELAGDAFMLETDSPYLSPVPMRGKRCEPAYLRATAEVIAAARGQSLADLARVTSETAAGFFRFPES